MKGARSNKSPASAPANQHGVVVNGYSCGWLRRGFCWVYPNEVRTGRVEPGKEIAIFAEDGTCLGAGIGDSGWIAIRRFRRDNGPIAAAVVERLAKAFALRKGRCLADTAWRLLNAENDDVPGVRIDVWDTHAVATLDSPHLACLMPTIEPAIRDLLPTISTIHIAYRRDPRDTGGSPVPRRATSEDDDVVVVENAVRFAVRPWLGKDAGLFTDMRQVRHWLRPHWAGRRVLNLFAHTGAFSVAAAMGLACEVETVDMSEHYLARARANFSLNGLDPIAYSFAAEESFHALDRLRRAGRRFDIVVVDPPGFSHSDAGDWRGEKDWPRLTAACLRVLEPGGWLVAASNLGTQSPREFGGALQQGAERAGRQLRTVHEGTPPLDHPAALHFPEGRSFKCWVMEAL